MSILNNLATNHRHLLDEEDAISIVISELYSGTTLEAISGEDEMKKLGQYASEVSVMLIQMRRGQVKLQKKAADMRPSEEFVRINIQLDRIAEIISVLENHINDLKDYMSFRALAH